MIAALTQPNEIQVSLTAVGLPCRAPPIARAHLGRQLEFDEAA